MPCVILLDDYTIIVVKDAWVDNLNDAENPNVGMDVNKIVKKIYSKNKSAKANFRLKPMEDIDTEQTGCYIGNVLNICGK